MTRVLYWNLLSCGANSLYPPLNGKRARQGDDDPDYGVPASTQDASDRKAIFVNVVAAVNPDIIAIVEIVPGPGAAFEGSPVNDTTAFDLLLRLRHDISNQFRLVPPLVTGTGKRAEGVAVYYRQDQLHFLGPFGWGGAGADTIANLGGLGGLAQYPAPWGTARTRCLPNRDLNAFVGIANWLPAHTNENTLAGQWSYQTALAAAVGFPAAGFRRPLLTAFGDNAGRLINLLTCHVPPQTRHAANALAGTANPRAAVAAIAGLQEIAGAMGANEVRCIVGDFNISAWDAASDPGSLAALRNAGYLQHLNPLGLVPPAPGPAPIPNTWPSRGYYATHVRSAPRANPWVSFGGGPTMRGYPGYGYQSTAQVPGDWYDAIDHAFTRYTGANGAAGFTIVNPVTGSPYNADPAPPPNVAHGTRVCASQMAAGGVFGFPPGISEHDGGGGGAVITFRQWQNYAKVRSLSDHFPLAIDL